MQFNKKCKKKKNNDYRTDMSSEFYFGVKGVIHIIYNI